MVKQDDEMRFVLQFIVGCLCFLLLVVISTVIYQNILFSYGKGEHVFYGWVTSIAIAIVCAVIFWKRKKSLSLGFLIPALTSLFLIALNALDWWWRWGRK
jgi:hypothetical protein